MRKQYKVKVRSCGLCKPHKRGWECRWKVKEQQLFAIAEREMRVVRRHVV